MFSEFIKNAVFIICISDEKYAQKTTSTTTTTAITTASAPTAAAVTSTLFFFNHTSNTTVTTSATYSLLLLLLLLYSFYSSCSCSSSPYYYYCHEGNCQMYMHYCLHCCSELSASTTYAKCAPPFMNSSNTKSELNQISYFTLDVDEMNGVFYLRNDRRGVQNYMVSGLLPTKLERDRNLSRTL